MKSFRKRSADFEEHLTYNKSLHMTFVVIRLEKEYFYCYAIVDLCSVLNTKVSKPLSHCTLS